MPRKKGADSPIYRSEQYVKLLNAAVQYVLEHGVGDLSLRRIAESLDTSHRMLIYHFKSGTGFWEAVLREIRHREQAVRIPASQAIDDPVRAMEDAWEQFSSDAYLPLVSLMFEIYVRAIREPERFADFLEDVITSWTKPITELYLGAGFDAAEAVIRADMQVAITRGLLLHLLTTGDKKATTAALHKFARMVHQRD